PLRCVVQIIAERCKSLLILSDAGCIFRSSWCGRAAGCPGAAEDPAGLIRAERGGAGEALLRVGEPAAGGDRRGSDDLRPFAARRRAGRLVPEEGGKPRRCRPLWLVPPSFERSGLGRTRGP